MTIYTETGLSISLFQSFFAPTSLAHLYDLTEEVESYAHEIAADGGYKKASFSFSGNATDIEDWFERGLGRHVVTYNKAQKPIWEGFVNTVSLEFGGLQIKRGPLLDISNRINVSYTPIDTSIATPTAGGQTYTGVLNDADSQARYGILSTSLSAGKCYQADAVSIRSGYLFEHRNPRTSQSLTLGGGSTPRISVECAGYVEYLDRNPYSLAATGFTTASAKLIAALAAEPNGIFSTNYSRVVANTIPTPAAEAKNQTIWSVIKGLVALGGAAYERWTMGIYEGRQAVYRDDPRAFAYQTRLADGRINLYGTENEVEPWDVLPARWIFYSDFLPGKGAAPTANLRLDPRAQFIESIQFTAPYGLSLSGGITDRLSQKMARVAGYGS